MNAAEGLLSNLLATAEEGLPCVASEASLVETLRRRGYEIREGQGRWFLCGGDLLSPADYLRHLRGDWGRTLQAWALVGSTNDVARAGLQAAAPDGSVFWAEGQSAGRGRQGRHWLSRPGTGLYFSFLLRPERQRRHWPLLAMTFALGLVTALQRAIGLEAQLKWPNDVLVAGQKLAGILAEGGNAPVPHVVVGIGVNLSDPDESLGKARPGATSVQAHAACPSKAKLLAAIVDACAEVYAHWRAARDDSIVSRFGALDVLCGKQVVLRAGRQRLVGTARGVDALGHLQVELPDGVLRDFSAGEVHLT